MAWPVNLRLNDSTLGGDNSSGFDHGGEVFREFTVCVTVSGAPSGFRVDIEALHTGDPIVEWVSLLTITAPGFYTVNEHWVRAIRANIVSLTGGTSPKISVTAAAPTIVR